MLFTALSFKNHSFVMERLEGKEISDSKYEEVKFKLFQEYGLKCLCHDVIIRLTDSSSRRTRSTWLLGQLAASSPVNVEKLLKKFKTQRCAIDFDSAF
jgi:ribosomal protein S26